MKPPRVSLRGLLILTACLAGFCYWRDRPRQIADRFVAAIEAGDYNEAFAMIENEDLDPKPPWLYISHWQVEKYGQSLRDWIVGRFVVRLWSGYGNTAVLCDMKVTTSGLERGKWQSLVVPCQYAGPTK